jgi:FKBP-type peptidyl-prolyl cis-trans isomerase (trigger factor)
MAELIKRKELQADSARVDKLLEEAIGEYEQPEQARQYFRANAGLMNQLSSAALEDQITELLLAQGEIKPVTMSLDELLKPPRKAPA